MYWMRLAIVGCLCVASVNAGDESLSGLAGVEVRAINTMGDASVLKAHIELVIRKSGIRILTERQCEATPGRPLLSAVISDSVVSLELRQDVKLARNPRIEIHAVTWSTSTSSTERFTARTGLDRLDGFLDLFMNDYLKGQPRSPAMK